MELTDRVNIVRYRMERAVETLNEVDDLKRLGYYHTAVNRMYYACFYAAEAFLIAHKITVKSHAGVRNCLSLHFVKTGVIPIELGRFYSVIFAKRSAGDYEDFFVHTLSTVEELQPQTETFVRFISDLVERWLLNIKNE